MGAITDKKKWAKQNILQIPQWGEGGWFLEKWSKQNSFSANLGKCYSKIINLMFMKILIGGNFDQSWRHYQIGVN